MDSACNSRVIFAVVKGAHVTLLSAPEILACQQTHPIIHPFCIHGHIRDRSSLHAPFLSQDFGHQTVVASAPNDTNSVEAGHNIHGTAANRPLEGFQIELTDRLFIGPYADAVTPLLLVIQSKMFDKCQRPFTADALHLSSRDFSGQPSILGVVFVMSTQILAPVNVQSRGVDSDD